MGQPLILAAAVAWAAPPGGIEQAPELLRYRQSPSSLRFQRAEDRPGLPPLLRGRGRTGPIEGWVWPDGTVARYRRFSGRSPSEDHHFDRAGIPWVTVFLSKGAPDRAVVHGWPEVEVALADWSTLAVGPLAVRGPGAAAAEPRWESAAGVLRATWTAGVAQPASAEFAEGVAEGCGCLLSERDTALFEGRAGIRWRLDFPHPTAPEIGELWAFPLNDGVFVVSWTTARSNDPAHPELAPGRAAVALLAWRPEDPT